MRCSKPIARRSALVSGSHVHVHAREASSRHWLEAELEAAVDRQTRLMELARHNGYEIQLLERDGYRLWFVPKEFEPIVGMMAAVVH